MPPENPHQQRPQRGHGVRKAEYLGPALQQSRHFSGINQFHVIFFILKILHHVHRVPLTTLQSVMNINFSKRRTTKSSCPGFSAHAFVALH